MEIQKTQVEWEYFWNSHIQDYYISNINDMDKNRYIR